MSSRCVLAMMDAAAIDADLESPLITTVAGHGRPRGSRSPSTRACCGGLQEVRDSATHGEERRLEEVELVDLGGRRFADAHEAVLWDLGTRFPAPQAGIRLPSSTPTRTEPRKAIGKNLIED